jgi:leucyl aminopeptidase (aminopeptidase T)
MKNQFQSRGIQMQELVRQVLDGCLNVKDGENVWIESWDHTVDLASEAAFACRQRRAHPLITLIVEDFWMRSLVEAPKGFLEILPSHQAAALERTDVFVFMLGPRSPIDWSRVPAEKQELANVWYLGSNPFLDRWRKVARQHSVRVLGVEYCLVTDERAKVLGLEYERWREVMMAGCMTDQQEIARKARLLADLIRKGDEVSVQTPSGTSLNFKLAGRKPSIGDSIVNTEDAVEGIVKFLPSGFVEAAADEDSAEGTVAYDVPVLVGGARRIEGLTLNFSRGRVVKYSAKTGVEAFDNYMKRTQGDADKFGFFGVGLNPGLKYGFTQDDKVLGGITVGIGGNEDKGGKNRTKGGRGWWAVTTQATLKIDEQLILMNGKEVF